MIVFHRTRAVPVRCVVVRDTTRLRIVAAAVRLLLPSRRPSTHTAPCSWIRIASAERASRRKALPIIAVLQSQLGLDRSLHPRRVGCHHRGLIQQSSASDSNALLSAVLRLTAATCTASALAALLPCRHSSTAPALKPPTVLDGEECKDSELKTVGRQNSRCRPRGPRGWPCPRW